MTKRLRIILDMEIDESKVTAEDLAKNILINTDCIENLVLIESDFNDSGLSVDDNYQPEIKDIEYRIESYDTNKPYSLLHRTDSYGYKNINDKYPEEKLNKEMEEMRDESWCNRNCL